MRYSSLLAAAVEKKRPHEYIVLTRKAEAHAGSAEDWDFCAESAENDT